MGSWPVESGQNESLIPCNRCCLLDKYKSRAADEFAVCRASSWVRSMLNELCEVGLVVSVTQVVRVVGFGVRLNVHKVCIKIVYSFVDTCIHRL